MTRLELEHIIRASAGNADCEDIVIIGSQAILGTYPNAPEVLLRSMEADVFPLDRPDDSILIDGAIGELTVFHETFGYYAHGVAEDTAVLPTGWKQRLVPIKNPNTRGCTGWCLEVADLAVAKLLAAREKDLQYLECLLRHGLVESAVVRQRLAIVNDLTTEAFAAAQANWLRLERLCSDDR